MTVALGCCALLVSLTIGLHYEILRLLSVFIPSTPFPIRAKVLLVVLGCFVAHTIEVWIYAGAYWLLSEAGHGALYGRLDHNFSDFLYFSATSYSTLGFGDISPQGAIKIVSGVEAINGLFLIAWSTSFTYFVMNKLWPLHPDQDQ